MEDIFLHKGLVVAKGIFFLSIKLKKQTLKRMRIIDYIMLKSLYLPFRDYILILLLLLLFI